MARKSKGKKLNKQILIYCEGTTEKNYFDILSRRFNQSNNVTVKAKDSGLSHQSLLEYAKGDFNSKKKSERELIALVVIIFDRDDVQLSDIKKAITGAKKEGILVGFSNISFEIWLLSHFEKVNFVYTRKQLNEKLAELLDVEDYSNQKANKEMLLQLEDYVQTAIAHTEDFPPLSEEVCNRCPYTNLGEIVLRIYGDKYFKTGKGKKF